MMAVLTIKSTATLTVYCLPRLLNEDTNARYVAEKNRQLRMLMLAHTLWPFITSIQFGCGSFDFRVQCTIAEGDTNALEKLRYIGEQSGGQWTIEDAPHPTVTRGGFEKED
jgi:hypothetical protein